MCAPTEGMPIHNSVVCLPKSGSILLFIRRFIVISLGGVYFSLRALVCHALAYTCQSDLSKQSIGIQIESNHNRIPNGAKYLTVALNIIPYTERTSGK